MQIGFLIKLRKCWRVLNVKVSEGSRSRPRYCGSGGALDVGRLLPVEATNNNFSGAEPPPRRVPDVKNPQKIRPKAPKISPLC